MNKFQVAMNGGDKVSPDLKVKQKPLTEWIVKNCIHGDNLKVAKADNGTVSILNERTGLSYTVLQGFKK